MRSLILKCVLFMLVALIGYKYSDKTTSSPMETEVADSRTLSK